MYLLNISDYRSFKFVQYSYKEVVKYFLFSIFDILLACMYNFCYYVKFTDMIKLQNAKIHQTNFLSLLQHTHTHTYKHTHIYIYIYIHIHIYIYIYIIMYIYIYFIIYNYYFIYI